MQWSLNSNTLSDDALNSNTLTLTSGTNVYSATYTSAPYWICPDLLRYEDIGAADNLRGRVVRAFFWLMRWWKC